MKYEYIGQRYTQGRSSEDLVTFVANASDIIKWGGVPAKNERFHGGFQRALNQRYKKIIEYFNNAQISPGAIVVAFRPSVLEMEKLGYPSSWPKLSTAEYQPNFVHLNFETEDYDESSLPDLIDKVVKLLESRLTSEELVGGEGSPEPQADNPDEEELQEEEEDDELDVGISKLQDFYKFLKNKKLINEWIASETKKIDEIKSSRRGLSAKEKEYVAISAEEKLKSTLASLLKPAMIVDGQHRVNGANESEADSVQFTVCAIKDADWVEQVFQFVVLNKMARSISKDFLTELLNTSLTNKEVKIIDTRLETIGIKNADRKIHKAINHSSESPFAGMISEAGEVSGVEREGKLSQQGMIGLAKRWRSVAANNRANEMKCYLQLCGASTLPEARKKWEDQNTWMPLFYAFWSVIKDKYQPEYIWIKADKFHLLYIVTLQAIQEKFIEDKAAGGVKFRDIDDFKEQVKDYFSVVPAAFFQDWTATGMQSGDGWKWIKEAVDMFRKQMSLKTVKDKSKLYEGKKS